MHDGTSDMSDMSGAGGAGGAGEENGRIRRMREQAQDLSERAERAGDPEESGRLREEAGKLEFDCEQESMMAAGDIYPTQ